MLTSSLTVYFLYLYQLVFLQFAIKLATFQFQPIFECLVLLRNRKENHKLAQKVVGEDT